MVCFRKMRLEDLELFQKWLATPHVAKWYEHPADWVEEVKKQDAEFYWIHHYIVEYDGKDIGFCQYYACTDSDELWEGYTALGGSYSIDYMIGEPDYLRKGFGREIGGTDQGTFGCQACCGSAGAGKQGVMWSFAGLWLCI